MGAMVEVAARLEEFLDEALVLPSNPFRAAPADEPAAATPTPDFAATFEGAVLRAMHEMGFRVAPTAKSPFAAITRETAEAEEPHRVGAPHERVVLTGFAGDGPDALRRAAATANLAEVTETFGVFFVERTTTRVAIEGTPVLSREELARVDDPEALIRLLSERRGRKR